MKQETTASLDSKARWCALCLWGFIGLEGPYAMVACCSTKKVGRMAQEFSCGLVVLCQKLASFWPGMSYSATKFFIV